MGYVRQDLRLLLAITVALIVSCSKKSASSDQASQKSAQTSATASSQSGPGSAGPTTMTSLVENVTQYAPQAPTGEQVFVGTWVHPNTDSSWARFQVTMSNDHRLVLADAPQSATRPSQEQPEVSTPAVNNNTVKATGRWSFADDLLQWTISNAPTSQSEGNSQALEVISATRWHLVLKARLVAKDAEVVLTRSGYEFAPGNNLLAHLPRGNPVTEQNLAGNWVVRYADTDLACVELRLLPDHLYISQNLGLDGERTLATDQQSDAFKSAANHDGPEESGQWDLQDGRINFVVRRSWYAQDIGASDSSQVLFVGDKWLVLETKDKNGKTVISDFKRLHE